VSGSFALAGFGQGTPIEPVTGMAMAAPATATPPQTDHTQQPAAAGRVEVLR